MLRSDLRASLQFSDPVDVEAALAEVHARARRTRVRRARRGSAALVLVALVGAALVIRDADDTTDQVVAHRTGDVPHVALEGDLAGFELVAVDVVGGEPEAAPRWGDPGIYVLTYRRVGSFAGPPFLTVSVAGTGGPAPTGVERGAATLHDGTADVYVDEDLVRIVWDLDETYSVRVEGIGLDRAVVYRFARQVRVLDRDRWEQVTSRASHGPPYGFVDGYEVVLDGSGWEVRAGRFRQAFVPPTGCVVLHGTSEAPACHGGATAMLADSDRPEGRLVWGSAPAGTHRASIEAASRGTVELTVGERTPEAGLVQARDGTIGFGVLLDAGSSSVRVTFYRSDGSVVAAEVL